MKPIRILEHWHLKITRKVGKYCVVKKVFLHWFLYQMYCFNFQFGGGVLSSFSHSSLDFRIAMHICLFVQ